MSTSDDHSLALRFAGLLHGKLKGSICASNGIHTGEDAIKTLLAGVDVFQAVSTLYRNRVGVIATILKDIEAWMDRKGYADLDAFRGKLSVEKNLGQVDLSPRPVREDAPQSGQLRSAPAGIIESSMSISIEERDFGRLPDSTAVSLYTLSSDSGLSVSVTDYGAIVTSVRTPDRDGSVDEVTLALDSLEEYLSGHPYYGSFIGRVCNRISDGGSRSMERTTR